MTTPLLFLVSLIALKIKFTVLYVYLISLLIILIPVLYLLYIIVKGYEFQKMNNLEKYSKKTKFLKYKKYTSKLAFLSLLIVLSSLTVSIYTNKIVFSLFSIFFLFYIITLSAMEYGYRKANYPKVEIYLEKKEEPIKGKALKFGEYIFLLKEKDGRKVYVNKDKIDYIEEIPHSSV